MNLMKIYINGEFIDYLKYDNSHKKCPYSNSFTSKEAEINKTSVTGIDRVVKVEIINVYPQPLKSGAI
jgi:hypothetical protein